MANQSTMTYGTANISPVPLMTITRQDSKVGNDRNPVGYTYSMTLTGTVTNLGTKDPVDFENTVTDAQTLRAAFSQDGEYLQVKCDTTEIFGCRPRIISFNMGESNDNWVQTVPYTIQLEYDVDNSVDNSITQNNPTIQNMTEEWNFEFNQDHKYFSWDLSTVGNQQAGFDYTATDQNNPFEARVTRTLSAVGKMSFADSGVGDQSGVPPNETIAAINAINYITGVYGLSDYNPNRWGHALEGIQNLSSGSADFNIYDHFRAHVVNETEGSVSITDTWFVAGANAGLDGISEDFTVNLTKARENARYQVSIEGQIQGREVRSYDTPDALTPVSGGGEAYTNAESGWLVIQDRLYPRAQKIFQQESAATNLNPVPLNKTVGHQPSRGIINYTYEYDDRLCSFISGSLFENFTIVDNNPADVFTTLIVPGRQAGPILQEVSTFTEATREVTIEVVMPPPTDCNSIADLDKNNPSSGVEDLMCQFETQLTTASDQVFKNADSVNWTPLDGRYTRTVGWTYSSCSGSGNTSFC